MEYVFYISIYIGHPANTKSCSLGLQHVSLILVLIVYMKKLLDSDWLRAVQFKCNTSAKSVTPVQKV